MLTWFRQARSENIPINGPLLLEKAHSIAIQLGSDFVPNASWLQRVKKRENISFNKLHGEKKTANFEGAETWKKDVLPTLLSEYEAINVFNAYESALFYKAMPKGSLVDKNEERSGVKQYKERITFLAVVNQTGDEKFIYVIGKYSNPRCSKNKNPPFPYYSNKKAWMTGELWGKIMASFNSKMRSKNRKVVLFCDNASCHKLANELIHVKIVFMPPNTTSIIQPLDQGIIRNIKVFYRTQLMREMVISLDAGVKPYDFAKSIISKALYMLKRSVFLVKPSTVSNCFSIAGFEVNTESTIVSEDDEPEVVLPGISSEEFTALVDIDEDYQTSGVFTDEDICEQILEQNDTTETTIIDNESEEVIPTTLEALTMIHASRLYCTTLPMPTICKQKLIQ